MSDEPHPPGSSLIAHHSSLIAGRRVAHAYDVNPSIIVLFGGPSDERHVSVASAQNVVRTLPGVLAWFWAPDGRVYDVAAADLLAHQRSFEIDFVPARPAIFPTLDQALDTLPVEDPAFFLALHGTMGEDGAVQRMLEWRGIPFTGSGSEASAAAFDKDRSKELVRGRMRIAESRIVHDESELQATIHDLLSRHERIVLKPLAGGSSRGLYFLGRNDTPPRDLCFPYILEQFIRGRELTVGVIDRSVILSRKDGEGPPDLNASRASGRGSFAVYAAQDDSEGDGPIALPVIEIEVDPNRTFDYEGKYLGAGTREICPANIPAELAREAQALALAAHDTLGCEGYSRTDVIAAEDGVYYLETNTLPGLTTSSLVPQELAVFGMGFREFLDRQVELARRKVVKSQSRKEETRPLETLRLR
jgi:D-alanine-D-alanine ligase